jgi:hypothetical protein
VSQASKTNQVRPIDRLKLVALKPYLLVMSILFALGLAGCGPSFGKVEPIPEIKVVTKIEDKPLAKMPDYCMAEKHERYKGIVKVPGNKTPASSQPHALQSNKRRMASNLSLAHTCECWIARNGKNKDDMDRLKGKCPETSPGGQNVTDQSTPAPTTAGPARP